MSKVILSNTSELLTQGGMYPINRIIPGSIVLNGQGEESTIVSVTPVEKIKFFNLVLKNGTTLSLGENSIVMTNNGPKKIQDIDHEQDYIQYSFAQLKSNHGKQSIPWEDILNTYAMPIKVPKQMSEELALYLGLMASKGRYIEANGLVICAIDDPEVAKLFDELTFKIFRIEPLQWIDKRNGHIQRHIISRNLVRFLKHFLGNSNLKKVPQQILEGSTEEQINFIRGLSLDGFIDQGQLTVYGGISKRLADFCSMVLRNSGYSVYQQVKKSGQGKSVYYTKINGQCDKALEFKAIEKSKQENINEGGYFVKITSDILETKIPTSHPNYSTIRAIRQKGKKVCYNYTLKALGIEFAQNFHYVEVKTITVENKNGFELETSGVDGLVLGGIVLGIK